MDRGRHGPPPFGVQLGSNRFLELGGKKDSVSRPFNETNLRLPQKTRRKKKRYPGNCASPRRRGGGQKQRERGQTSKTITKSKDWGGVRRKRNTDVFNT